MGSVEIYGITKVTDGRLIIVFNSRIYRDKLIVTCRNIQVNVKRSYCSNCKTRQYNRSQNIFILMETSKRRWKQSPC